MVSVTLDDEGMIHVGHQEVGYLGWYENTIVDIMVEEESQGEGIATEAVGILVDRLGEQGYDTVETNVVLSPAMETVLHRNDFYRVEDADKNQWRYEFTDDD